MSILVFMKWYLIILICTSLMTNETDHLFKCLLAIYISKMSISVFVHFLIGLVAFLF